MMNKEESRAELWSTHKLKQGVGTGCSGVKALASHWEFQKEWEILLRFIFIATVVFVYSASKTGVLLQ